MLGQSKDWKTGIEVGVQETFDANSTPVDIPQLYRKTGVIYSVFFYFCHLLFVLGPFLPQHH